MYHHRGLVETNVNRPGLSNKYRLSYPNALEENWLMNCRFLGTVPLFLLHWYLKQRFLFILLKHFIGTVSKYLLFTNQFPSSALGYNNQYLFNKRGRFTFVSTSPRWCHSEVHRNASDKTKIHICIVKTVPEVDVNKPFLWSRHMVWTISKYRA